MAPTISRAPRALSAALTLSALSALFACAKSAPPGAPAEESAARPPPVPPGAPAEESAARPPPAPPAPSAPSAAPSAEPSAAPAAEASAEPSAAPAPEVEVVNIGMHIGGGPHDAPTKAPIKLSVAPHFPEIAACWSKVEDPDKAGDLGVDLRIPAAGGLAKVSSPRTALKGEGFVPCVVAVFERIEFRKPKGGDTVVSYSLRFSPKKR